MKLLRFIGAFLLLTVCILLYNVPINFFVKWILGFEFWKGIVVGTIVLSIGFIWLIGVPLVTGVWIRKISNGSVFEKWFFNIWIALTVILNAVGQTTTLKPIGIIEVLAIIGTAVLMIQSSLFMGITISSDD
jgi:hypothetical protein